MSDKAEFNLLHEPWIVVMHSNGKTEEVGMLDLFARAHEFHRLAGELTTQDIAVLRQLLAILHSVFGRYDPEGEYDPLFNTEDEASPRAAFNRWREIWEKGRFSGPVLRNYLERYEDRFWLFHPERPFYQVPGLDRATEYTAAKLNGELAESSNKLRLFASRSGEAKGWLTYAEAARWLLYIHGYDDTSAKPKGKGQDGEKLPSPGAGWLGKLGLVVAEGENLFETLMLNYTMLRDGEALWSPGVPIWELDAVRSGERCEIAQPGNPAGLLTLQSRRILLRRDRDKVVGYSLLGGDFFTDENAFVEQMTVWRISQGKKNDPDIYRPRRHDPSRQLWRDFAALVVNREGRRSPGVVSWVSRLQDKQYIKNPLVRFRIAAVKYGDKDFFIDDVFSDGIAFHRDLLEGGELGGHWIRRILDEIEITELLVRQVGLLAQNIARAEGDSDKNRLHQIADATHEQAYYRLDRPFRRWLESIDPARDKPRDAAARWWQEARDIVRRLGQEIVRQCGPHAYAERVVKEKDKEYRFSVPLAYNQFIYRTYNQDTLRGGKSA